MRTTCPKCRTNFDLDEPAPVTGEREVMCSGGCGTALRRVQGLMTCDGLCPGNLVGRGIVAPVAPVATPAPVTGETTDAGEGEGVAHGFGLLRSASTDPDPIICGPAASDADDASEVEALAKAINEAEDSGKSTPTYIEMARHILASDWYASLVSAAATRAADDRAERIAQAIEAERSHRWQKHLTDHPYSDRASCPRDYGEHDALYAAARIARTTP